MRIDSNAMNHNYNKVQVKHEIPSQDVDPQVVQDVVLKQDNMKYEENVSEISEEIQNKAIEDANKALVHYHRKIEREVHEKTKTIMYKVMDTETNEVIREFPPKKIQDMIAKMWELAGLFVDEKA
jgi:flagellar protein FlaG